MKKISFLLFLLVSLIAKSQKVKPLTVDDALQVALMQKAKINEKDIELYNRRLKLERSTPESIRSKIDSFKQKAVFQQYTLGIMVGLTEYDSNRRCYYLDLQDDILMSLRLGTWIRLTFGKLEKVVVPLNKVENMTLTKMDSVGIKKIYAEYLFIIDTVRKIDYYPSSFQPYLAIFKPSIIRLYADSTKRNKIDEIDLNASKVSVVSDVSIPDMVLYPVLTGIQEAPKDSEDYDRIYTVVQIPPEFPGGETAWLKFLENNLNKSVPTDNHAPNGIYNVVLSFIVTKTGTLSEILAENDPGYGTKEEAIRILKKSALWKPANQNGRQVHFRKKLSISFKVSTN
jgi:hypothetical protein